MPRSVDGSPRHVRIGEGATDEEASAVAAALAEHLGVDIEDALLLAERTEI